MYATDRKNPTLSIISADILISLPLIIVFFVTLTLVVGLSWGRRFFIRPRRRRSTSPAGPDVVWCEKPIASSVADAEDMIEVCSETETELVINHSFRFTDKLQTLYSLIQEDGLLGDVHSVSTQFRVGLLRNSTYLLDTLVYLLDARADRVSGFITGENEAVDPLDAGRDVDDAGSGGFVVMDDGTSTKVDCTVPRAESSMTLNVIGTARKLYMNNDDGYEALRRVTALGGGVSDNAGRDLSEGALVVSAYFATYGECA